MSVLIIWGAAALAYLGFRFWYDGLGRPLTADELTHFIQMLESRVGEALDAEQIGNIRKFGEEDDGREFIMVNLVEYNPSPVKHVDTGQEINARELLGEYTKPFLGNLLRRAGHPVIAMQGVGGYLDAWNTPPDPGWHMSGLVRYRSRRDMLVLATDPAFAGIHKYKIAAMHQTFAFPAQTQIAFYASLRVSVALVLALFAAVLQLILS